LLSSVFSLPYKIFLVSKIILIKIKQLFYFNIILLIFLYNYTLNMNEIAIVTSSKESIPGCIALIDIRTGSQVSSNFKNCVADSGTICVINGSSSFSGNSPCGSGDYIAVAQSNKPLINIWQWGKPQVMLNFILFILYLLSKVVKSL
jgi:hypothetical protein